MGPTIQNSLFNIIVRQHIGLSNKLLRIFATDGISSVLTVLESFTHVMFVICRLTGDGLSFILKKLSDLVEFWRFLQQVEDGRPNCAFSQYFTVLLP